MAIRDEILKYIDGNLLVTPEPYKGPGPGGSDNGPLYTSMYYIILKAQGDLSHTEIQVFQDRIEQCITKGGMLNRAPRGQDRGQEGPDDYLGVLSACKILGITHIPAAFLFAIIKNLGFLNNSGIRNANSFMLRFPQLVAGMVSGAFPSLLNPIHMLIRAIFFPFYLIAALVIAFSCIDATVTEYDKWNLTWHLIHATAPTSFLCKLASLLWYSRLYKVCGKEGMKTTASTYFKPSDHPLIKYWVE